VRARSAPLRRLTLTPVPDRLPRWNPRRGPVIRGRRHRACATGEGDVVRKQASQFAALLLLDPRLAAATTGASGFGTVFVRVSIAACC